MSSDVSQELVLYIPSTQPKLWSMHYVFTLIVNLIINISSIILITLLPLFTISIGGNNLIAGLLTTILTASALIFRPIFGKMLDEKGRKVVLILGLCLFAVSTIFLVFATNILMVLVLRFLQGIGLSGYSTALGTIISDIVPAEKLSEGVGYFGISATIAMAVGPTLGLYLCGKFGYQVTFASSFAIALLSVIFAIFIRYEGKTKKNSVEYSADMAAACEKEPKKRKGKGFIEKSAIKPCIVVIFTVFPISAVFSFMPLFGEERGIDNIGLFFTLYAVAVIIARLVTGKAADRFGYSKVFLPAIAITFMLFITLSFAYSLPAVLLAAVFYGIGYGTVQPILNAIVIKTSSPERRGAATATYYATLDTGFGIGSFTWGAISQVAGFTAVFLSGAFFIVLSVLAFWFILHPMLKVNE